MGWAIASGISALVLILFSLKGKFPRIVLELAVAAVLVALAGYSWQGRPDTPGNPVSEQIAE